jgi:hypothetical protein
MRSWRRCAAQKYMLASGSCSSRGVGGPSASYPSWKASTLAADSRTCAGRGGWGLGSGSGRGGWRAALPSARIRRGGAHAADAEPQVLLLRQVLRLAQPAAALDQRDAGQLHRVRLACGEGGWTCRPVLVAARCGGELVGARGADRPAAVISLASLWPRPLAAAGAGCLLSDQPRGAQAALPGRCRRGHSPFAAAVLLLANVCPGSHCHTLCSWSPSQPGSCCTHPDLSPPQRRLPD